jgi:hypothetical protein
MEFPVKRGSSAISGSQLENFRSLVSVSGGRLDLKLELPLLVISAKTGQKGVDVLTLGVLLPSVQPPRGAV